MDKPELCCSQDPKFIDSIEIEPGNAISLYQCEKCKAIHKYRLSYPLVWHGDEKTIFTKISVKEAV